MAASTASSLTETDIQQFASALLGGLIQPNDANYDEVRAVYNAMIDKRPALIARCTDAADVIAAVNFAPRARTPGRGPRRWPQRHLVSAPATTGWSSTSPC